MEPRTFRERQAATELGYYYLTGAADGLKESGQTPSNPKA